ncbi:uncharacterized protein LOC127750719 isoform X2 [Frankliniella occidentalis]|uniref:Uncharacterized protein LOC127750719 isoform X2 n=1 Tax=Frankliniella occidentalis TaxID=133901 RepID=A0A9C6XS29_FRAOC|nr:uncharacterized protein LOC127750719 isoform X2 [Frankliniella occidentalis]
MSPQTWEAVTSAVGQAMASAPGHFHATAGTSTAGTSTAGTSTAGTSTAGTSTAGTSTGSSGSQEHRGWLQPPVVVINDDDSDGSPGPGHPRGPGRTRRAATTGFGPGRGRSEGVSRRAPWSGFRSHKAVNEADRFPLLAMLARQYLSIPASSAETERTFSEAGWILNKRRKRLCMTTVDDLIILHANCKDRIRERLSKRKRRKGPD